jgi:biopolymer transport protein ExbD
MSGKKMPEKGPRKQARIEIIPLIDVIFFLLATFILFTLSLDKINSLEVQLPQAVPPQGGPPPDEDETVTLQVSDQGSVYWNRELINISEVTPRLQNHKNQYPNARVLIATDDRARYALGIEVLDKVRKEGIDAVSVETRVRPTGR